ncbi:serine/threonine-protein phosphatase 4 regulatory subunit 2-B [Takifugu rubripes]|uniref:Protein phosphatase 4, regulatory subunit 2b n=1 Tax=Takifugu rubripes TaxID=31033 RepID=H2THS9_TAKRU|nr:serine/threonine-protein phosphatase 4 regulatory subunit 2 [Takifugu rubripes]|eukprot:XP_011612671.1 PREDICTED: serine/threonine-protein phosphatase 4 regulatory subunit 2 [Takifugu rubripes]
MEIDSLQEALRDFDKKAKKETCPLLEQFLCHVAKTGETLVQWSQFKNYFLFKLEEVMDDFRASAPEQRGPANPNVESIPFEDMKERILKIVNGYNGIPFTIQRLCELLTEPKRNYTGTDKFLRGVEKNVMVVSCVYPTSEKNGCNAVNRMNGVMLPGNTSAFTERKVNGPGTPRPLGRPKGSLVSSLAANGLPDSTDSKDLKMEQSDGKDSSDVSASGDSPGSSVKNKHDDAEDDLDAERHEVKRLKFSKEEDEDDEEEEEEEQEAETLRPAHVAGASKEAEAMVQEEEKVESSKESHAPTSALAAEDQEPSSSTQAEPCSGSGPEAERADREVPCGSQEEATDTDQTEQQAPTGVPESPESSRDSEESSSDPVSSSSSSSGSSCSLEDGADAVREDVTAAPASSTTQPPTEGAVESATSNTGTPKEQD